MHYDNLPKDSFMLLSFINMKLRDEYDNLAKLCQDYNESIEGIMDKLRAVDYIYDESLNQFVSV